LADSSQPRLRVAVLGCGAIASYHLNFLKAMHGVSIVGVADTNIEAAHLRAREYEVPKAHASLDALLDSTEIDAIHILTPPSDHYRFARAALERGIHVVLEKPLAFSLEEVSALYDLAGQRGALLCPDYPQLFHPRMQQAIRQIESGCLGRILHVEAHYMRPLDGSLTESRELHWAFQLPGGVLHNYITHPLYLAMYFTGRAKKIEVTARSLGTLPQDLTDDVVAHLEGEHCTASVGVSMASRTTTYDVVMHCTGGTASVNFDTSTIEIKRPLGVPRALERGLTEIRRAASLTAQTVQNTYNAVTGGLVPYHGLRTLLEQFYAAARSRSAPPISRELAAAVTEAEIAIARQCRAKLDLSNPATPLPPDRKSVLVTGGTGYLGMATVRALSAAGYLVRVLARPTSHVGRLRDFGAEVFFGDVRSVSDLQRAANGVHAIVHLAAGIRGNAKYVFETSSLGTQNVADTALRCGIDRVVYLSSIGVYDYAQLGPGDVITEDTPLDNNAETLGAYSKGKRAAEDIALQQVAQSGPAWTILRPSFLVGNGRDTLAPIGPRIAGFVLSPGSRSRRLLLIHVEDVAAAMVAALGSDKTRNSVFVLSGADAVPVADYYRRCVRPRSGLRIAYVPYWLAALAIRPASILARMMGRGGSLHPRRLRYLYRDVVVGEQRLSHFTSWRPTASLLDRLAAEQNDAP
jgi:2-alkyl-3-oxoalkanoate reductase